MRIALLCLAAVACAGALVAVMAGASTPTPPEPPYVALSVTGTDAARHPRSAWLTCRGTTSSATSFLRPRATRACAAARRLGVFLASRPRPDRICTQIYGGPDVARIRGRVGARLVDRRFSRRNGCEIADWRTAQDLLFGRVAVAAL